MKLLTFCFKFQTLERILRVGKSEITGENTLNGDFVDIEDNYELFKDKKKLVVVFLKFCDPCFNP